VTLVVGEKGMDTQLEKMMKMMDKSFTGAKKVLEVNMDHPIIRNLARLNMDQNNRELISTCIQQLFASAQLLEGNLASPAEYVQRTLSIMEKATK
jgi:molecular chaperone HtpG